MITFISGEDTAASRSYYTSLKAQEQNPMVFMGETLELTDLIQAIDSGGLFDAPKTIFIEELFSKKKSKSELDSIVEFLNKKEKETDIILWESKPISKSIATKFKKTASKEFSFPKHIFAFVDTLRPGNGKELINLFHQLLKTNEPEFALFMMTRQMRLLLGLFQQSSEQIEEVSKLQTWQLSKLSKQAHYFALWQLVNTYKKLYEIDLASKTGRLNTSLLQAIDFFLLEL